MTGHHAIYCAQSIPQTDSKWALHCMDLSTQQHLQGIQQARDKQMGCTAHPLEKSGVGKVRGVPQALIVHVQGWAAHVIRVRAFRGLPIHGQVAGIRVPCAMAQQRHTHSQASTISITGSTMRASQASWLYTQPGLPLPPTRIATSCASEQKQAGRAVSTHNREHVWRTSAWRNQAECRVN